MRVAPSRPTGPRSMTSRSIVTRMLVRSRSSSSNSAVVSSVAPMPDARATWRYGRSDWRTVVVRFIFRADVPAVPLSPRHEASPTARKPEGRLLATAGTWRRRSRGQMRGRCSGGRRSLPYSDSSTPLDGRDRSIEAITGPAAKGPSGIPLRPVTIAPNDFTHLHVHSEFSLLDGLGRITELVDRPRSRASTRSRSPTTARSTARSRSTRPARQAGIKPIIGVETYVARRSMTDREGKADAQPYHLILLAKDWTGYRNLAGSSPTPTSTATTTSRASTATTSPSTARA